MPIRNFPFIQPSPGSLARPMLYIRVVNPDNGHAIRTMGLIDTGADECAFPAAFAAELGYNLQDGTPKQINTGNGVTTAYSHPCLVEILDTTHLIEKKQARVAHTIGATPVDFLPNLNGVLLGVNSFLSRFVLTIDYPKQTFSVKFPS